MSARMKALPKAKRRLGFPRRRAFFCGGPHSDLYHLVELPLVVRVAA